MPRPQQDKNTTAAKANASSQPEQANANDNATASRDLEILKAIRELRAELKEDTKQSMSKLSKEINDKLGELGEEINGKLDNAVSKIQDLTERMEEAETRTIQIESWTLEATTVLSACLEQQRKLQAKVTDLESRSRRNNVRIFGLPEGVEENSVPRFIESFLTEQLQLPGGSDLKIQRAHRSLTNKPPPEAPPRAIIVNFLEYSTKEMILREAWKKKIQMGSKTVYFDHDYPPEIVARRKEYTGIKKILKEKGIRFQTPYTNMRIHWESGTRTYSCARDVYSELRRRGFQVALPAFVDSETNAAARLRELLGWQQVENSSPAIARRAKAKLQEFQRDPAD
ncbi:hypothetical protein WMY93_019695 [Mugilogobius chulae]|uniref:L1 transposable element RRM domain-containing protein n=1 Tax=Mugilogobius chulae TaxID=88201 RepID=A0AAW0NPW7_9GOBI